MSGPAAGWNSGTCGFTSVHNIFVNHENVKRLDGKKLDLYDIRQVQVRASCEICGEHVICDDYPTAPFRHMKPEEVTRYVPDKQ